MKKILFALTIFSFAFVACSKMPADQLKSQLDQHSSQLIVDWTDVQLRLIKNTTGVTHVAYSRHFSYTGIAVY
jgi:hypothetical protein